MATIIYVEWGPFKTEQDQSESTLTNDWRDPLT